MSELRFDTDADEFASPRTVRDARAASDLTGLLVKWGIAASRQKAEYMLMSFAAIIALLALWSFLFGGGGTPQLTGAQTERIIKNQQDAHAPRSQ